MKYVKKYIKYAGIVLLLLILFRGFIYRALFHYTPIAKRDDVALTDKNLTKEIDELITGKTLSIKEIIHLSHQLTSEKLHFTFGKALSNPNKVCWSQKANCIGYAALFNAIGSYIVAKQNQKDVEFSHLVGTIDFLGFDIHRLFKRPFFKNHDFNEVRDKKTGEKWFVDASLRDYFWIGYVATSGD